MKILAADIGGTNSRFALFDTDPLRLVERLTVSSRRENFSQVLDSLLAEKPQLDPMQAEIVVLAVAGPIEAQKGVQPSNLPYYIDLPGLKAQLPLARTRLINDFGAQAWACLSPAMSEALPLLPLAMERPLQAHFVFPSPDPARQNSPCALIGAGTGLGMAMLSARGYNSARPWEGVRVLASEGGHSVFPFLGKEEQDFSAFALDRTGLEYIRGDDLLTGGGLALLHSYLSGEDLEPAELSSAPDFASSPTCAWFARFYGRACRDLALTCLPESGLLVSGGLVANCPMLVQHPAFLGELDRAPGEHQSLLRNIPFWYNPNHLSGLWGAAMFGWAELAG